MGLISMVNGIMRFLSALVSMGIWVQVTTIIIKRISGSSTRRWEIKENGQRSYACAFVIDGKGYIAAGQTAGGSYRSNYWIYDPLTDLWDGEDLTDFEGSTRSKAVCFSTGKRGIIATGGASTYYYDDTWELKPYEYEEK